MKKDTRVSSDSIVVQTTEYALPVVGTEFLGINVKADKVNTGTVFDVTADAITTGAVFNATCSNDGLAADGDMMKLVASGNVSGDCVDISLSGTNNTGTVLNITQKASNDEITSRAVKITSDQTKSTVMDIIANSLDKGNLLNMSATGLTDGSVIESTSTSTVTDGGTSKVLNYKIENDGTNSQTGVGLFIDYTKNGVTDDSKNAEIKGIQVDLDDKAINHSASTVTAYGLDVSSNFYNKQGTIKSFGAQIGSSGADGNIGLQINCDNESTTPDCTDLKITSSVTNSDYFGIKVENNGQTYIRSVNGGYAGPGKPSAGQGDGTHGFDANLYLEAHGDITLNAHGGVAASGTGNGDNADIRFRHDDKQFVRFQSVETTNTSSTSDKDMKLYIGNTSSITSTSGIVRATGTECFHFQTQSASICDVQCTGNISCNSDRQLKKNILPLENSLDKIKNLKGVTFNWKDDAAEKTNIGFIAQEVEEVIPELVSTNNDGIKSVSYTQMVSVLTEAMKTQQTMIENQQKMIESLNREIENLKKK